MCHRKERGRNGQACEPVTSPPGLPKTKGFPGAVSLLRLGESLANGTAGHSNSPVIHDIQDLRSGSETKVTLLGKLLNFSEPQFPHL